MTWQGASAAQGALASSAMQPSGTTLQFFRGDGSLVTFTTAAIGAVTWTTLTGKPTFSTVATSGAYSDLTAKPTLGTAAASSSGAFATAAQGALAGSALQSFTETDPVASPALVTHAALLTTAHGGIVAGSDSRLTNSRTPTAHATSHASGGSDPVSGLMTADTGWTANSYAGVKTASLVTYSLVINGTMSTALGVVSTGLGASLVTMDQTIQLLVQQVAALRTALVAAKLPNV